MKKENQSHRLIATVFFVIFLPTVLPINLLYASNNGPTAPEAASFEPVDASDMVNLLSGDVSYVMPLLNVPSPEGGYPLSLSYHAGIAMDQEASWVGLGWTLNPGAINRSISGVPDDWKRTKVNQIVYDAGGQSTGYTGSISVGWGQGKYSVGLYASYSENKNFGGENTYSLSGGAMGNLGNYSASVGTDGASLGMTGLSATRSFKNGSSSVGVGIAGTGVSFDTKNGASPIIGGHNVSFFGNNHSLPSLNIVNTNYSISIPIKAVTIGLGYQRTTYWTYQKEYTQFNGSLYVGDMTELENPAISAFPQFNASDSYESLYKADPDTQLMGDNFSFIAYDNYSISGQGISGSMKPQIFQHGSLVNRQNKSSGAVVSYKQGPMTNRFTKTLNNTSNDIHFYMENENSSFLKVDAGSWNSDYTYLANLPSVYHAVVSNQQFITGLNVDGQLESGYWNPTKRKKSGTYIETFTNKEILLNPSQIIAPGDYNRSVIPADGIGAFRVTAMDGKVYHYSLPVYQKEKFSRSSPLDKNMELQYYEEQQVKPYATHWLLTAITGPDYVDINNNNLLDDSDYGYWVEFDYGKWSDGFSWRTPKAPGAVKTNDKSKFYEWGVKEIYYLDKIRTRTHTALFIKETRADNQSTPINISDGNSLKWIEDLGRSFTLGSDNHVYFTGVYDDYRPNLQLVSDEELFGYYILDSKYGTFVRTSAHKSLKLKNIILLKNSDSQISKSNGNAPQPIISAEIRVLAKHQAYNWVDQAYLAEETRTHHNKRWYGEFYNSVYDIDDLVGLHLDQKAFKIIDLETDYSLATNSPNSTDIAKGRLTLKKVKFLGQGGIHAIPAYSFNYNTGLNYDINLEDNWGYHSKSPMAWSLNKITTPTGGEINIVYEPDDISREAVSSSIPVKWKVGGGLRVKEIKVIGENLESYTSKYFYNSPGSAQDPTSLGYVSSGITSYVPQKFFREIKYISELPPPSVIYEYVTVQNYSSPNIPYIKSEYKFQIYTPLNLGSASDNIALGVLGINTSPPILNVSKEQAVEKLYTNIGGENLHLHLSKFTVLDFASSLGRILRKRTFNAANQEIESVHYNYKASNVNVPGITAETFGTYKRISPSLSNLPNYRLNVSTKISGPNVLESIISTSGGVSNTLYNDKYDFLTGQLVERRFVSSNGTTYKTRNIPAYHKYDEMGSKVLNANNKNMLSQSAVALTYVKDPVSNVFKETGVGITTWSNLWRYKDMGGDDEAIPVEDQQVWRKHETYTWNGIIDQEGIFQNYNSSSDDGFDWTVGVGSQPSHWKKTSEITLYNHFSAPLEVKDINNNLIATKLDSYNSKIIAKGNAGYNEMFYAGAESILDDYWLESEVRMVNAVREATASFVHTGSFSVRTTSNSEFGVFMRGGQHKPGKYKLSVWVHKDNAKYARLRLYNNQNTLEFDPVHQVPAGRWILMSYILDVPAGDFYAYVNSENDVPVYYDDFRLHPVSSTMTSYVYDKWNQLTFILGPNNFATHFVYDSEGRLIKTYIEAVNDPTNNVLGGFMIRSENLYYNKNL